MPDRTMQLVETAAQLIEGTSGVQLMNDAGLSWQSLNAWRKGRRRPSPASLRRFGEILQERGRELQAAGEELITQAAEAQAQEEEGTPPGTGDPPG